MLALDGQAGFVVPTTLVVIFFFSSGSKPIWFLYQVL